MFFKALLASAFAASAVLAQDRPTVYIQPVNGAGIQVDNESHIRYDNVAFPMNTGGQSYGFHVIWSGSNRSPYCRITGNLNPGVMSQTFAINIESANYLEDCFDHNGVTLECNNPGSTCAPWIGK